jgi:hypothetical protein
VSDDETTDENGRATIDRLIRLAEADTSRADWRMAVLSLKGKKLSAIQQNDGLLRAAQAMRDAGVLDETESHYLISQFVEFSVEYRATVERSIPALVVISDKIKAAQQEVANLQTEYDRVWDDETASAFEDNGEPELAAVFRRDQEEFDRLTNAGRVKFKRRKFLR